MNNDYKSILEEQIKETKVLAFKAVKNKQPKIARNHIKKIKELDKKMYKYNFESVPYDLSKSEDD